MNDKVREGYVQVFHEYEDFNEYETLDELKRFLLEREDVTWFIESEIYEYLDEPDMILSSIKTDEGWNEWMKIVDEQMKVLVQRVNILFESITNLK